MTTHSVEINQRIGILLYLPGLFKTLVERIISLIAYHLFIIYNVKKFIKFFLNFSIKVMANLWAYNQWFFFLNSRNSTAVWGIWNFLWTTYRKPDGSRGYLLTCSQKSAGCLQMKHRIKIQREIKDLNTQSVHIME